MALLRDNQAISTLGCSDSPPEWLDSWPGTESFNSAFAPGVRAYAARIVRQERTVRLTWQAARLLLRIGSQRAIWQMRGSQWTPSCSCGYADGYCPHAYAAAKLFQEVAETRGWLNGHSTRPSAPSQPPSSRSSTAARRPATQPQLDFEWDAKPSSTSRLIVEADVHHEPGQIVLRFFRQERERSWLTLQSLYNLCRRAAAGSLSNYPEADARFLAWLGGRMNKRSMLRSNRKVLKLSAEQFARWQDAWENAPGRFIERASQKPFGTNHSARLHFELSDKGEKIEIAAVATLADGRTLPYHRLAAGAASGEGFVLDGERIQLDAPVSQDLLSEVFAQKNPSMQRRHVAEYLPHLLEKRLDLVHGPAVRRTTRTAPAQIALRSDGANFVGEITIEGRPFHPASGCAAQELTERAGVFDVAVLETDDRDAIRAFLRKTEADCDRDGVFRIGGNHPETLVHAWQKLPETVETRPDPCLMSLLYGTGPATATIRQSARQSTVEFDVLWFCGDRQLTSGEMQDLLKSKEGILRTSSGEWLRMSPEDAGETMRRYEAVCETTGAALLVPEARKRVAVLERTEGIEIEGMDRARRASLLTAPPPAPLELPAKLRSILRSYQRDGFEFLAQRLSYRTGPLLADDMGLGKTLQVLAVMQAARDAGGLPDFGDDVGDGGMRTLVVCPASVTSVWMTEAAKFCPDLRCSLYRGPLQQRSAVLDAEDWDVLVTNYALVRQDAPRLQEIGFDIVVLDEAQAIKNPDAQVTRAVKSLSRRCGLALTGTPLENRAVDLWSVSDFLNPGFLGSRREFEEEFPPAVADSATRLAGRIRPTLMRRTKQEVATELPPLTQELIRVDMTEEQASIYRAQVERARDALSSRGPMEMLAALTRLRQVCCHPDLLPDRSGCSSAKLDELVRMLQELTAEGHHALVFSQFVQMLEQIAPRLDAEGIPWYSITGKTEAHRRAERIRRFNESEDASVFLLSLRAAGTGITLTRADYVFIYDPWWNPAVERQAIDRTHRIGQDQPVFAYRMIAANSIEEKVLALQREKAELFDRVVGDSENSLPPGLTRDDLAALLASP